jgi:hypothetical protein
MRRASNLLFLGGYLSGGLAMMVMLVVGICCADTLKERGNSPDQVGQIILLALVPWLVSNLLILVLIYRMWNALQGGVGVRTTPGKAVGLMFVPFFNLYWLFQVVHGWTQDYNSFRRRHQIQGPIMPEGLAQAYCVLSLLQAIPGVGTLILLVNFFICCALIWYFCNGINAIANWNEQGADPNEGVPALAESSPANPFDFGH